MEAPDLPFLISSELKTRASRNEYQRYFPSGARENSKTTGRLMQSQEANAATGLQRCNRCWNPVTDQFYRTSCLHAFCKTCCFEYFSNHKNCPLCNTTLGDEDFGEPVDVGVGLQRSAVSAIFMEAFSTNQLEDIAQTALTFLSGVEEFSCFMLSQLYLECQRLDSARERLYNENKQLKSDAANLGTRYRIDLEKLKSSMKEMETRLNARERELRDARNAYEEEKRKCIAYEKLNKRRLGPGGISPSSTPPVSPQSAPQGYHQRGRYPPPPDQGQSWNQGGISPVNRPQHPTGPYPFSHSSHAPSGPAMPGTPNGHRASLSHRLSPVRQQIVPVPFRPTNTKFSPGHILRRSR